MGEVHFPEQQLSTYLRAFMPGARLDEILDQIAQAAIEAEAHDEMELFALAHWLMDPDERRTDELEAVVLVEEVGLPPREVAYVLGVDVAHVEAAVAAAWAEVPQEDDEPAEEPVAPLEVPERAVEVPVVSGEEAGPAAVVDVPEGAVEAPEDTTKGPVVPEEEAPDDPVVPEEATRRRRPSVRSVLAVIAVIGLAALAVAVFSEAGQARLLAVGLDPVVAFLVAVGFIVGGAALDRAGSPPHQEDGSAAGR